jgi:hypothetical protein
MHKNGMLRKAMNQTDEIEQRTLHCVSKTTLFAEGGNSDRRGLGSAVDEVCFVLLELFGLLINMSVSKASFSACPDGMRSMPCRAGALVGVVG